MKLSPSFFLLLTTIILNSSLLAQPHRYKDPYLEALARHNKVSELLEQPALAVPAGLGDAKLPDVKITLPASIELPVTFDSELVTVQIEDEKLQFKAIFGNAESQPRSLRTFHFKELPQEKGESKDILNFSLLFTAADTKSFLEFELDVQSKRLGIRDLNLTQKLVLSFPGFQITTGRLEASDDKQFPIIESRQYLTIVGKELLAKHTGWHLGPQTALMFTEKFVFGDTYEEKGILEYAPAGEDKPSEEIAITRLVPDGSYITGPESILVVQSPSMTFKAGMIDVKDLYNAPYSLFCTVRDGKLPLESNVDIPVKSINIDHAWIRTANYRLIFSEPMNIMAPESSYQRVTFSDGHQYILVRGLQPRVQFTGCMNLCGPKINIDEINPRGCFTENIIPIWAMCFNNLYLLHADGATLSPEEETAMADLFFRLNPLYGGKLVGFSGSFHRWTTPNFMPNGDDFFTKHIVLSRDATASSVDPTRVKLPFVYYSFLTNDHR